MNSPFRGQSYPGEPENQAGSSGAEPTAVLPETAAQLVEMERLQQALAQAEERAKNHWDQYLRAVADIENVRRRAQKDVEAAHKFGIDKLAAELLPVQRQPGARRRELGQGATPQQLAAGSQATLKLLAKVFEKLNVVELESARRAVRSGQARGDAGAAVEYRRTELGAAGGAAGLRAQRPAAAARASHRRQSTLNA